MNPTVAPDWGWDWAWGLLLIVLTVIFHAYCLGLLNKEVSSKLSDLRRIRHFSSVSIFVIGGTALSATILHAFEGSFGPELTVSLGLCQTPSQRFYIR